MGIYRETNERSASTTCTCETCKITGPPRGTGQSASARRQAGRAPLRRVAARDPRKPLQLSVAYVGGAEPTWVLQGRGEKWHVCGHLGFDDVLRLVNGAFYTGRPS